MASTMTADAATVQNNGLEYTNEQMEELAQKLTKLRDDILAGSHPRLKLPKQADIVGRPQPASASLPAKSSLPLQNGVAKSAQHLNLTPSTAISTANSTANSTARPQTGALQDTSPNIQKVPVQVPVPVPVPLSVPGLGSSGIDPIFLTKSDVLVKAELHQKRQRLERALDEQEYQIKVASRQKVFELHALPEFDVTEVLKRAHERVKPIKLGEAHMANGANGATSSSDSFDENTFYSSQMNESTTTEEADESRKWRPRKICRFFLEGKTCKYGTACTFSHDPLLKQRLEADGSQAMDLDSVNADEQTSPRQNISPPSPPRVSMNAPRHPSVNAPPATTSTMTQKEREIAQLEEQIRRLKEDQQTMSDSAVRQNGRDANDSQEGSAYSPPGPDEFGRDMSLRELEARWSKELPQKPTSTNRPPPPREYARRMEHPTPPLSNDVRVVRNHITSPFAPQPARVSPLALAKVPQISQEQRNGDENRRPSRISNAEVISAGQSPQVLLQPIGSRKRRRGHDPGESIRNVMPRRDLGSPDVRIKEEPVSPIPFQDASELRRTRQRQELPRPMHVETASQLRPQERAFYQARHPERASHYDAEDRAPLTPVAHRIISRNGQRYIASDEPDLRRVVSARQVRPPMSPAPYAMQYSEPQPRAMRAASHVYVSPIGQRDPQYRASVQPQPATYLPPGESPSPPSRTMQVSPTGRHSVAMAPPPRRITVDQYGNRFFEAPPPPPRRITVDQYGNRFFEAPAPPERQFSTVPVSRRPNVEVQYEQMPRRSASVRQPQFIVEDDAPPLVRRAPSPTSPHYDVEYAPRPRANQVMQAGSDVYGGEMYAAREEPVRMVYPESRPAPRYEEFPGGRQGMVRMHSVRPAGTPYDMPREQMSRVQSVRPQPSRIVSLGDEAGMPPANVMGAASIGAENGFSRHMSYAVEERPQYHYAAPGTDRGFVEEDPDDGGLYDAASQRRMVQRM